MAIRQHTPARSGPWVCITRSQPRVVLGLSLQGDSTHPESRGGVEGKGRAGPVRWVTLL